MDEKDKRIAELESENAKLKADKNKKKKKDKTKFALSHLDLFKPTLETIKKQDRYIFTRGKQQVIKINEFIRDLLVAKIKLESPLSDSQIGSRLSMDEASLIKFLSDSRAKKVGAGRKKTIVKQAKSKPPQQEMVNFSYETGFPEPVSIGKGVGGLISGGVTDFTSMSVDEVFAYCKDHINPLPEVRQSLIKQLTKHGASDRLDELRSALGVSVSKFKEDVASVSETR